MQVSMNGNISQTVQPKKVSTPVQKSENKEKGSMSTGTKVAIGTGLVALATLGVYAATRGKVKTNPINPTTVSPAVNEVKEMVLSAFREAGNKLQKGKAILANGEMFSGTLNHVNKDGTKLIMEYENGVLKSSTKMDGSKELFNKTYEYLDNGVLNNVKIETISSAGKKVNNINIGEKQANGYIKYLEKQEQLKQDLINESNKRNEHWLEGQNIKKSHEYEEIFDATDEYWHTDVVKETFWKNGNRNYLKLKDGSIRKWTPKGKMIVENNERDGIYRTWDIKDGHLEEIILDTTDPHLGRNLFSNFKNGDTIKIKQHFQPNGMKDSETHLCFHQDSRLISSIERYWYENGSFRCEIKDLQ